MKTMNLMSVATIYLVVLSGVTYPNTGWAKSVEDTIQDQIEGVENGINQLGADVNAIQDYLNNYPWKGIIQERATSGAIAVGSLELNGSSKAVVVQPGEKIAAKIVYHLDPKQNSVFDMHRIVIGIQGEGAQTVIGDELGLASGKTKKQFTIIAPHQSGLYQIRFKLANTALNSAALDSWKDEAGNEPDETTTIGIIYVQ